MITCRLQFSEDEMCAFFKKYGYTIIEVNFKEYVRVYHNKLDEFDKPTKCIVNLHDGKNIPVSVAFEKVIFSVKNALLLDNISKLTVLKALAPPAKKSYLVEDFEAVMDDDNNYGCDGCYFACNDNHKKTELLILLEEKHGGCANGHHYELKTKDNE